MLRRCPWKARSSDDDGLIPRGSRGAHIRRHVTTVAIFSAINPNSPGQDDRAACQKALDWARRIYPVGARLPTNVIAPTEETAGYVIPTLCDYGERDLAISLAKWEASQQRPDGAFSGDGVPYTFDTAQVIRGFLALVDTVPELERPLKRACDYVEKQIAADGRVHTVSYVGWRLGDGTVFSDYCHLYALPPLLEAGRKLSERRYIAAVERAVAYFKRKPDLVKFKPELATLSHIFGYMMEALVELGELDLAREGLQQAAAIQRSDGAIPAYPGADWVCSTGLAQLAVAWYRLGDVGAAHRALDYLETVQNPSGGFYGGYGRNAQYFPDKEIGWAVKYFLDALRLREKVSVHQLEAI
jgi:malonyl-CoA O-methyltransferase